MKYFTYLFFLLTLLNACTAEPQPIEYGKDACSFCKMNIVDAQHAAEMVTKKGKAFKFDAIECMMNHLNRNDISVSSMEFLLVNDYDQPGVLIDAITANYIRSEGVPSPMGGFLSAFESAESAAQIIDLKGGEAFNWDVLKERYKVK